MSFSPFSLSSKGLEFKQPILFFKKENLRLTKKKKLITRILKEKYLQNKKIFYFKLFLRFNFVSRDYLKINFCFKKK